MPGPGRAPGPAPQTLTVGELQHLVDDTRLVLRDAHVLQDLRHHLQGGEAPLSSAALTRPNPTRHNPPSPRGTCASLGALLGDAILAGSIASARLRRPLPVAWPATGAGGAAGPAVAMETRAGRGRARGGRREELCRAAARPVRGSPLLLSAAKQTHPRGVQQPRHKRGLQSVSRWGGEARAPQLPPRVRPGLG